MKNFISILFFLACIASAYSKNIASSTDDKIVWFPNPKEHGSLLPANLTPTPGAKAGDAKDIHFLLYTNLNKEIPQEIFIDDKESIDKSNFDTAHPVKLLIHGFGGSAYDSFPANLRKAYVNDSIVEVAEKYNIIAVDWEILAASPDYFTAVANAQICAEQSAKLLKYFVDNNLTSWEKIHLVGFSLGGQVVGQIGWRVQELDDGGKIARITALDPAIPLFDVASPENRTDPSDAVFVDTIHTSANGILGVWEAIGHIDFYPNGGRYQPGCGIDITGSCGHSRAPSYFVESVFTETQFWGRECESYEKFQSGDCDMNEQKLMGHFTTETIDEKTYFLDTKSESPFAIGPFP